MNNEKRIAICATLGYALRIGFPLHIVQVLLDVVGDVVEDKLFYAKESRYVIERNLRAEMDSLKGEMKIA